MLWNRRQRLPQGALRFAFMSRRSGIHLGITMAFAVALVLIFTSFANHQASERAFASVEGTHEVIGHLDAVSQGLLDMENRIEDYIQSGQESQITLYRSRVNATRLDGQAVSTLTGDNPAQQRRAVQLRELIEQTLHNFETAIHLRQSRHPEEAAAMIYSNDRQVIDPALSLTAEMKAEELRLLKVRMESASFNFNRLHVAILLSGAVTLLLLVVTSWMLRTELAFREKKEKALQEQKQILEAVVEGCGVGILAINTQGRVLIANAHIRPRLAPGDALGDIEKWPEKFGIYHSDRRTLLRADELPLVRTLAGQSGDAIEAWIQTPGSAEGRWARGSARPLLDKSGNLWGGVTALVDVSEQKAIEAALSRQTQFLEAVVEGASIGLIALDEQGLLQVMNHTAQEILGDGPVNTEPSKWPTRYGLFHADKKTILKESELPSRRAYRGETVMETEIWVRNRRHPEGVWAKSSARPLRDASGAIHGAVTVLQDVTERKQTLEDMQHQKELLKAVVSSMSNGLVVHSLQGEIIVYNRTAEEITGLPASAWKPEESPENCGFFLPDMVTPFPREDMPIVRAIRGDSTEPQMIWIRNAMKPDGVWITMTGRPVRDASGQVVGGLAVIEDITELQKNVEALRRQTQLLEAVFENVGSGLIVADPQGHILIYNRMARKMAGGLEPSTHSYQHWSEEYGLFLPDQKTYFPAEKFPIIQALSGVSTDNVEMWVQNAARPQGFWTEVSGRPLRDPVTGKCEGGIAVMRDITENKRLTAELEASRAQTFASARMAALGVMAGSVAHEINTPLTVIHASACNLLELAEEGAVPASILLRDATRIRQTAERIARIVRSMRLISREGSSDPLHPVSVRQIV